MKNITFIILWLLAVAFLTSKAATADSQDTLLLIKNVKTLNVAKGRFVKKKNILINNGKIVKMATAKKRNENLNTIDLKGYYLLPGLIDVHVHVSNSRKNNIENTYAHLNYFLRHGITSVRDAGGDGSALKQANAAIQKGKRTGPSVYYSAFMAGDWYYNRGQHLRNEPYSAWEQRLAPGSNLDSAMTLAKNAGVTGVKLYHSFDGSFLPQVVDAAKRHGLKVWGHTMQYPATPIEVVNAGVQVLSHVSMLETLRKPDTLFYRRKTPNAYRDSVVNTIDITEFCNQMKKHNAILDATICVSVDKDPWVLKLLKRVHEQGVKIAAGTDQIVDLKQPYPRLIDELSYFVNDCGFSPAEAIRSATIIAAEVVGQEQHIGSIQTGKRADLIVLKENPLKNIKALANIEMVFKNGQRIK